METYNISSFLDSNVNNLNYYTGILNINVNSENDIENKLKIYKNLDFLSISILNLPSKEFTENANIFNLVNLFHDKLHKLSKKYNFIITSSYEISLNPIGYFNCWNSKLFYYNKIQTLNQLNEYLQLDSSAFLTLKKPHIGILYLKDNSSICKKISSIEVSNNLDYNKYSSFEKIYFKLLDKGWYIGAISDATTNLKGIWYTGVICQYDNNNLITEAINNRSTYSTSDSKSKLYFSINKIPLGKVLEIDHKKNVSFYIYFENTKKLSCEIEVITNNTSIIKNIKTIPLKKIQYTFKYTLNNNTWFIIRVKSQLGVLAISSPIFVKYKI